MAAQTIILSYDDHPSLQETEEPPVILLGALGGTRRMWDRQIPALTLSHRVIAVDQRGHGLSPAPQGAYTIPQLADDVINVLDALDIPRAHIIGLSMGGAIAQQLGLSAPLRVASLVLISTAAKFGTPQSWEERIRSVENGGTAALADGIIDRWFTPAFRTAEAQCVAWVRRGIVETPRQGYIGCCEALSAWDSRRELPHIQVPTLIAGGRHDPGNTDEVINTLLDGIPNSRYCEFDPAAHVVTMEQADLLNNVLVGHLNCKAH